MLHSVAREWSIEGENERKATFDPIVKEVSHANKIIILTDGVK